eukprot:COSAG05_NODE_2962_length_2460_cov_1.737399_3_plen_167_part_00
MLSRLASRSVGRWATTSAAPSVGASARPFSALAGKIDKFVADVEANLPAVRDTNGLTIRPLVCAPSPTVPPAPAQRVRTPDIPAAQDGKGVAFASAWLATDNVIVALFKKHTPAVFEGMSLVGVDTLHLFPTTYDVADEVQVSAPPHPTIPARPPTPPKLLAESPW